MRIAFPDDDDSREEKHIIQNNTGSGAFVGGNNYGPIHAIDPKTSAVLASLAEEAPGLAELMRRALREGLVSPDAVYALEIAARNINADVAEALLIAGRNINEDVAGTLRITGARIENGVNSLPQLTTELAEAASAFGGRGSSVSGPIDQLESVLVALERQADRIEVVVTPPPAEIVVNWRVTLWAFGVGVAIGFGGAIYLINQ